jgi:hypothetical protein
VAIDFEQRVVAVPLQQTLQIHAIRAFSMHQNVPSFSQSAAAFFGLLTLSYAALRDYQAAKEATLDRMKELREARLNPVRKSSPH